MGAHVFLPEGQSLYYGVIKRPFFPHHGGRQWYAWWSPKGTGVPTPNQRFSTGSMHAVYTGTLDTCGKPYWS